MKDLLEGLDTGVTLQCATSRCVAGTSQGTGSEAVTTSDFDHTSFSPSASARPFRRPAPAKLTVTAEKGCWVHVPENPQAVFVPRINPEGQISLNERRVRTINGHTGLRVSLPRGTTIERIGNRFFIPAHTECSLVDGKVRYPDQLRSREFSGLGLPVTLTDRVEVLRPGIVAAR